MWYTDMSGIIMSETVTGHGRGRPLTSGHPQPSGRLGHSTHQHCQAGPKL